MKKLAAFILCFSLIGCDSILDVTREEAINAFAWVWQSKNIPNIPKECNCGGTGRIRSADGIIDMECQCGPNCTCQKSNKKITRQVKYYYTDNCSVCKEVAKSLDRLKEIDSNWKIGEADTDHIQKIKLDAKTAKELKINAVPLFVRIEDGIEVEKHTGAMNEVEISNFFYGR